MASAKQRYVQLMEWLEVRKQTGGSNTPGVKRTPQRFSKADTYNKTR